MKRTVSLVFAIFLATPALASPAEKCVHDTDAELAVAGAICISKFSKDEPACVDIAKKLTENERNFVRCVAQAERSSGSQNAK